MTAAALIAGVALIAGRPSGRVAGGPDVARTPGEASGVRVAGASGVAGVTGGSNAAGVSDAVGWSAPATLSDCAGAQRPSVTFPSDSPEHLTGAGALVWSAGPRCSKRAALLVAAIGADDLPRAPASPRTVGAGALALDEPLAVSGAPHGRIVIAGSAPGGRASGGLLSEGRADGPFTRPLAIGGGGGGGAPALARGYLGDVAVASPVRGASGVQLRVQRYFRRAFARPLTVEDRAAGPVEALHVALDYRSDALVLWRARGAIYARELPSRGPAHSIQRLAATGGEPRLAAVLSDDNRAIVAWADRGANRTSVYVDISAPGVRFGRPTLLEQFTDADGLRSPDGSPTLVRLSSETVLIAWAGVLQGHWVVRVAPVYLDGVQSIDTISAAGTDALLADLAPGPRDEALVLWTEPEHARPGQANVLEQAIFAARGLDVRPGASVFGTPEQLAAPGPNGPPAVAIDPGSDRAVAVWSQADGAIQYAIRAAPQP